MRAQGRIGVLAREVGGGDHELEALGVCGRCAYALVHVAAADPLGAGSYAYLVTCAIVPDGGADGVGAVAVVIAGLLGVGAAGTAAAVDGVPPVIVVVGGRAVPATILVLDSKVCPAYTSILACYYYALACVTHGPHLGRVHVYHSPFDDARDSRRIGHFVVGDLFVLDPALRAVRLDLGYVRAGRQALHE